MPVFDFNKRKRIYLYRHLTAQHGEQQLPYQPPPWRYSLRVCLAPEHETLTTSALRIEATTEGHVGLPLNASWVKVLQSHSVTSLSGPGPARILLGDISAGLLQPLRIQKLKKLLLKVPAYGSSRDWTVRALKAVSRNGFIDPRVANMTHGDICDRILNRLDARVNQMLNAGRFAANYTGPVSPCPTFELFTMNQLSP